LRIGCFLAAGFCLPDRHADSTGPPAPVGQEAARALRPQFFPRVRY
jgi:hypothetical protein